MLDNYDEDSYYLGHMDGYEDGAGRLLEWMVEHNYLTEEQRVIVSREFRL